MIDNLCKRYGQLPADVVKIDDPVLAYQFNMAVLSRGVQHECDMQKEAEKRAEQRAKPPISIQDFKSKIDSGQIEVKDK